MLKAFLRDPYPFLRLFKGFLSFFNCFPILFQRPVVPRSADKAALIAAQWGFIPFYYKRKNAKPMVGKNISPTSAIGKKTFSLQLRALPQFMR